MKVTMQDNNKVVRRSHNIEGIQRGGSNNLLKGKLIQSTPWWYVKLTSKSIAT